MLVFKKLRGNLPENHFLRRFRYLTIILTFAVMITLIYVTSSGYVIATLPVSSIVESSIKAVS